MGKLDGIQSPASAPRCRVREILNSLEPEDVKILETALSDDNWTAHGLSNALRERGVRIDDSPIKRHRRGICSCSTV